MRIYCLKKLIQKFEILKDWKNGVFTIDTLKTRIRILFRNSKSKYMKLNTIIPKLYLMIAIINLYEILDLKIDDPDQVLNLPDYENIVIKITVTLKHLLADIDFELKTKMNDDTHVNYLSTIDEWQKEFLNELFQANQIVMIEQLQKVIELIHSKKKLNLITVQTVTGNWGSDALINYTITKFQRVDGSSRQMDDDYRLLKEHFSKNSPTFFANWLVNMSYKQPFTLDIGSNGIFPGK